MCLSYQINRGTLRRRHGNCRNAAKRRKRLQPVRKRWLDPTLTKKAGIEAIAAFVSTPVADGQPKSDLVGEVQRDDSEKKRDAILAIAARLSE
jgi:hypothetical protein